jgi:hypothetical protein
MQRTRLGAMSKTIVLMVVFLLIGCKTVQRATSETDSVRRAETTIDQAWQREIVREFVPHVIVKDSLVERVRYVEKPMIIRETIREAAQTTAKATEQEQVKTDVREVIKETVPPWFWLGIIGIFSLFLMGILVVLIRRK